MANFSYKDRKYIAIFSLNANAQKILVITNAEGIELHITKGVRKAIRKYTQGNNREIDLQEP